MLSMNRILFISVIKKKNLIDILVSIMKYPVILTTRRNYNLPNTRQ